MLKKYWGYFSDKIGNDVLLGGSLIILVGSLITSAINYLYHFVLGRMLGPSDYGVFSSLLSLTYVFGVPVGVLNLITIKYISSLREGKGVDQAAGFFRWFSKKALIFGFILLLFSLAISPLTTRFLRLSSTHWVILTNLIIFLSVSVGFYSSTLQGFLRFKLTAIFSVLSSLVKILLATVFIYLGWQLNGVLFSLILTSIFALLLINFFINKKITLPKVKEVKVPWREISKYGLPVLFSNLAQTSFYTSDVLLVKSLFPADQAGLYASLSILGKIVFFASSSIGMVMFPLVAGKKARGENYRRIYLNSFLLVFLVSFGITLVYFLFPKLMVNLLYGSQYLAIAPLLGLFAVFMSFYALVYLTVNFFLAAARTVMIVLPITGAVLQVILIYFYHSSLRQVVLINIWVMAGLFFGLIALPLVKYLKSGRLHSFVLIKKNEKITA